MYTAYFGFHEQPFRITPDPRFFYANPQHEEVYANLLYGIHERKGCIVLVGEAGTGKTTLLRRVMENLEKTIRTAFFYNTTLTFDELLDSICSDFDLPVREGRRLGKIQELNQFLLMRLREGGTAVLMIDEAQNLSDEVLENLRLLSNFETTREKLLQIVLVGQPELETKLERPELRQLKQRIAIRCRLDHLKARNVGPFIYHRLRIAGCERQDLFSPEAIQRIAVYSKGIPRLINTICDNALLLAYGVGAHDVSEMAIEEVAQDLLLKGKEVRLANETSGQERALEKTWTAHQEPVSKVDEVRTTKQVLSMEPQNSLKEAHQASAATFSRSWVKRLTWVGVVTAILLVLRAGSVMVSSQQTTAQSPSFSLIDSPVLTEQTKNEPDPHASALSTTASSSLHTPAQPVEEPQEKATESIAPPAPTEFHNNEENGQLVTILRGNTISAIVFKIYGNYNVLAFDLIKEFNPHIQDLDRVAVGEQVWLPFLTRDTLLRKQEDGSYHLILGSFHSEGEAKRIARAVRRRGYAILITSQRISGTQMLHRVEIEGLQDRAAVDHAWNFVVNGMT